MENKQNDLYINIIKALRNGTVPNKGTNELAVGIENELNEAFEQINDVKNKKTAFKFIVGDYGSGKTFLSTAIKEMAYNDNFVVSSLTISKDTPLHKFDELYKKIMENLRIQSEDNAPALSLILEEWLLKLEDKILSLTGIDIDEDFESFKIEMSKKIKEELTSVDAISGSYSSAIYNFYEAKYKGDTLTSQACINWLKGEKINSELRNKLGISGNLNKENSLSFLKSFLYIIKTVGYEGLVVSLDELETIQRISRVDIRKTAYENLRLFIDESDKNAFPYCYFLFTGTNELMKGENGFKSLKPLYQRITIQEDKRFKNLRQPIMYIDGFNEAKLIDVAKKVIKIHEKAYKWSSADKITEKFLNKLINETILGLQKSRKEVAPRGFIRILVDVLDKSEIHLKYEPIRDFSFTEDVENMFMEVENNIISENKNIKKDMKKDNSGASPENKAKNTKKEKNPDVKKEKNEEKPSFPNNDNDLPLDISLDSTHTPKEKDEENKKKEETFVQPIEKNDDNEIEDILSEGFIDDKNEDENTCEDVENSEFNLHNKPTKNDKKEEKNLTSANTTNRNKDNQKQCLSSNENNLEIEDNSVIQNEDDDDDFLNEILCEDVIEEELDTQKKKDKKNQINQKKEQESNTKKNTKKNNEPPKKPTPQNINNNHQDIQRKKKTKQEENKDVQLPIIKNTEREDFHLLKQQNFPQKEKVDIKKEEEKNISATEYKQEQKQKNTNSTFKKDEIIEIEDDLSDFLDEYLNEEDNVQQKEETTLKEKQNSINNPKKDKNTKKIEPDTTEESAQKKENKNERNVDIEQKEEKSTPVKKQGMFGFFKKLISSDEDEEDQETKENERNVKISNPSNNKDNEELKDNEQGGDVASAKVEKWKQAMSLQVESNNENENPIQEQDDDLEQDINTNEDNDTPMFFGGEYKVLQNIYIETEDGDREKFDQLIVGPNGVFFTRNVEDSGTLTLKDNTFYNRGKISHRLGNAMEVSRKILKEVLKENEIESEVVGIINLIGCESENNTYKDFKIMNEEKIVGFVYNFKPEKKLNVNQVGKIYKEIMSFNDI